MGIVIGSHWRAWRFLPGWESERRKILWAEAVGFELLVRTIIAMGANPGHLVVYGDNDGVVKGWWNGRSANEETNNVFKRIHAVCESSGITIHTRYVSTHSNPADDPSRGRFPPRSLLLPPIPIPDALVPFIVDFDTPNSAPTRAPLAKQRNPVDAKFQPVGNDDWIAEFKWND